MGQPVKIIRKYSVKKRSISLDFIFDTCASASSSHFFGWWSWTCVSVPFCKDNCIFSKKNMCFAIWARVDTKFLNSSHHVLSVDDWPGDAIFFLWANLWRSSASIQSKKVQPLGFYFWPLRLCLLKSLFWLVKVNICGCTPFAKSCKESYSLNSWGLTFGYVLVNSQLIHPPPNSWLLTLGILQTYPLSESFMIDFLMPYTHTDW